MPALIQAGWFTQGEASYLSVATLAGYVLGAWLSDFLGRKFRVGTLLRGSMLICSLSFLACAIEGAVMPWYGFWRTAAGFCGAVLMVLPAPAVLPQHHPAIRGRASGIVFSGIGLGAVVSGALVPPLISGHGVTGAWLGMGGLCLGLTLLSWKQWSAHEADAPAGPSTASAEPMALPKHLRTAVRLILAAHALNAIGYLAHTLFWVDYIVRELKMPLATGGLFWALFGLGAAIGPLLTGSLADVFGLKRCLIAGFALKAFSAVLPVLSDGTVALFVSSLLMGIFTPGIVALVSAYALDRVGAQHHRKAWGMATFSFAVAQAAGGFLMAYAATRLDSYHPLFCISAIALVGAMVCIAVILEQPAVSTPDPHADAIDPLT